MSIALQNVLGSIKNITLKVPQTNEVFEQSSSETSFEKTQNQKKLF